MGRPEQPLQDTYVVLIGESVARLDAASQFLHEFGTRAFVPVLEAAILQIRKALELIAIAAIAPDKKQYTAFRATATKDPDFTKDYHAAKIFAALGRINPDFYPKPLLPATRQPDGSSHYADKVTGRLSKKQFERVYDRLGKHLHAHNPWGANKQLEQLAADLPEIIERTRALIVLHARLIRTSEFQGVWIVEADSPTPHVLTAIATGPYVVQDG